MAHPSSRYQTQLSRQERDTLILEARGLQKQKLKWFKSPRGRLLRTVVSPHVRGLLKKRTRCGLYNVNNSHNLGSIKVSVRCTKCGVPLCNIARSHLRFCWDEWHAEENLHQRINNVHAPRRKNSSS